MGIKLLWELNKILSNKLKMMNARYIQASHAREGKFVRYKDQSCWKLKNPPPQFKPKLLHSRSVIFFVVNFSLYCKILRKEWGEKKEKSASSKSFATFEKS